LIKQPVAILGRGRCGTSALAGALQAGGWKFPGKKPGPKTKGRTKTWIAGYLEVGNGVRGISEIPKTGNYKNTGIDITLRGDETPILMTRDIGAQTESIIFALNSDYDAEEVKKSIRLYNKRMKQLGAIEIRFEDLMWNPRDVLSRFDIEDLDAAVAFINPHIPKFL